MNKLFYIIFITCAICACSDSDTEEERKRESDFYELKSIPDKEIVYKGYQSHKQQILGAGYDVTAGYLSFDAIKAPVIDLEKIPDDRIYRMNSSSSEPVNYAG